MDTIRSKLSSINHKKNRLKELKALLAKELENPEDIAIATYTGLISFGYEASTNIIVTRAQLVHAIESEIAALSKSIKIDADTLSQDIGELSNGI